MGIIIYSFNLNISPKMSYGVLECDIVMLQNYMLMIYNKRYCNKKVLFVPDLCMAICLCVHTHVLSLRIDPSVCLFIHTKSFIPLGVCEDIHTHTHTHTGLSQNHKNVIL